MNTHDRNLEMSYSQTTEPINGFFGYFSSYNIGKELYQLRLSRQITLGYVIMLFLIILISGSSIYNIRKLEKATSNIEGRYKTLSSLLSDEGKESQNYLSFENEMLIDAVRISNQQVKYSYISTMTAIGIAILFGGILTLMVPRVITRPIYRLVDVAKAVASGDYSHRIKSPSGGSEISTLIQAFNNMLENVEGSRKELEEKNQENLNLLEASRRFNEVLEGRMEEVTREIKAKQEELIKSEKLAVIGELATGIAHEIKNPLSGISVALELMKNETQNQEHKQTISDILKEIDRLDRIIKEILQLARPRSLNLIECDPNEVVERALSLVSLKAEERGISIEKRLGSKERFQVDPEQIQQVLINLLINGIEAMNGSGKLTVETESSNGYVEIRVSDTGLGFSDDVKEKIFHPFYSDKEHGTGLGLSISTRIVETHGGRIVTSSEKGKGATFTVVIPKDFGQA